MRGAENTSTLKVSNSDFKISRKESDFTSTSSSVEVVAVDVKNCDEKSPYYMLLFRVWSTLCDCEGYKKIRNLNGTKVFVNLDIHA